MADKLGLEWSEENQALIERFMVLASGRDMCLAYVLGGRTIDGGRALEEGRTAWVIGWEAAQKLLREIFDKPDLMIKSWEGPGHGYPERLKKRKKPPGMHEPGGTFGNI